ncbi:MAG: hypothetical protein EAZ70_12315 [Runella slithyformis]|nr:MAG: hypothetical protein EAZ80_00875 [Runella slithyformis]TAF24256.1 MAG: hypothetical protein EAZ70_12315 [Runella slithyformis]TAF49250.1 MAG: hypothetical protein EAZ63_01840 [Runella slithyformis]TAF81491.1 MAG: hypothetical protein EAZ50_06255 [Runella slithyformis]TAH10785.1 MAG: hypothetical protein EAZ14_07355 [Runella slithyformis]
MKVVFYRNAKVSSPLFKMCLFANKTTPYLAQNNAMLGVATDKHAQQKYFSTLCNFPTSNCIYES